MNDSKISEVKKVKCADCRNRNLVDFDGFYCKAKEEKVDIKEFSNERECSNFDSKYIQYPIEVSGIDIPDRKGYRAGSQTGKFVKIRPCKEDKTFLGIYLGEIDAGMMVQHSRETKELKIYRHFNPAIFVPDLNKVVFGCESWWGIIESEDDLKEITNDDIENVWYVKALKTLCKDGED